MVPLQESEKRGSVILESTDIFTIFSNIETIQHISQALCGGFVIEVIFFQRSVIYLFFFNIDEKFSYCLYWKMFFTYGIFF